MTAVQSSLVMLPTSIVLAMVFRNIQPRPTEQRLIKDLLLFDDVSAYAEMVRAYEHRKYQIDTDSFKSMSDGSLPTKASEGRPADSNEDVVDEQSVSSSSSSSSSELEVPPSEDEFVTPKEETPATQATSASASETASSASKLDTAAVSRSEFSTAIETDIGNYVGPLPWWVGIIAWIFAILASVACGFFIILYTFTFGYEDSKAWCTAVLLSFFFGLFLEQPIKILLVAFALAFICRKATDIYPSELDIVADHSVRGKSISSPVCLFDSLPSACDVAECNVRCLRIWALCRI